MGEDFSIRPMQAQDVDMVVRVHLQAFSGFFLTFLGSAFLRELYLGILQDPFGIACVGLRSESIVGFVAGTDCPPSLYSRLLRRRWAQFALASLGAFLRRPSILPRLMRAVTMPRQADLGETYALLMSLAVLPAAQSGGVGKALVRAFLKQAADRRVRRVILTTDKFNNDAVNRFYSNCGFVCSRAFVTPEGRHMNEYVISVV